ncbi:MAG: o-succinylbenzoate synthase [Promicromonosporaceae bacterium]|nr:o-succinylbenzoate synthase [Promicromonosporaceae bacterium]
MHLAYSTPLRTGFRGLTARYGLLLQGARGWGDFCPFADYDDDAAVPWLLAAREAAEEGWPAPVRDLVPVNVTIPAVGPSQARALVLAGAGCSTAKVKVAQLTAGRPESLTAEVARVEAVAEALEELHGSGNWRIRLDVNGAWSVPQALRHLFELHAAAGSLEYVEQPCATVDELAELRLELARSGLPVLVAADESIRLAADPLLVASRRAADVVVLKVAPLGGVRACLQLAERLGLPVVVSSALESSLGLAAGLALAGALPELPFACGLATSQLLINDVIANPLLPTEGHLPVLPADHPRLAPAPGSPALQGIPAGLTRTWQERLARVGALAGSPFGAERGGAT